MQLVVGPPLVGGPLPDKYAPRDGPAASAGPTYYLTIADFNREASTHSLLSALNEST
jgi:hypothetical protein